MLIIITGGLGFLGSSLAKTLSKKGYKIIVLDKKKNKVFKKSKKIKVIENIDIVSLKSLNKIKIKKKNIILHCAGQPSAAKSFDNPRNDLFSNVIGTFNLINWAKKNHTKKIIYASTFNVYEEKISSKSLKETHNCNPKSFYAISKLTAENYIQVYCNFFNIKWNILRMFNIYGPGQDPKNKYLGMINIYLNMAKENSKIVVKGSLNRFRDFVFIDDVIKAWEIVIKDNKNQGQIYNVGSGKKTSVKKLIKEISVVLSKKIAVKIEKSTPGDFLGSFANINKIKKNLNFKPCFSLKQGLKIFNKWIDEKAKY